MFLWFRPIWLRLPASIRRWMLWLAKPKFMAGVAALCFNERGEILLLDHPYHPDYPWGLPGGWLDRGETPAEGIVREILEETGYVATDLELVHVGGDGRWINIFYRCRVPSHEPTLQTYEIRGYCWADPAAIPVRLRPDQQQLIARVAEMQG